MEHAFDIHAFPEDAIRRIRGDEFERMCEAGLFGDERVELLRGVLVAMGPMKEPHARITAWLGAELVLALARSEYEVRQGTAFAPEHDSRPQPDIAVYPRVLRRTLPSQALLLIEVSDTSLRLDRTIKLPLYAECGVPEYWIVDVNAAVVEVYTEPAPTGYGRVQIYRAGDTLRPTELPQLAIAIDDIPFLPRAD